MSHDLWETGQTDIIDALPEWVLVVAPDERRLLFANAAARSAGADRWWEALPGIDRAPVEAPDRDGAGENADGADAPVPHPAAEGRWLSVYRRAVRWRDGAGATVPAMLLRLIDVTRQTRHRDRLHQLSQAVEQSPGAVVITDTAGLIVYVNPAFERISGYAAAEALGRNPRFLKSGHTAPEEYARMWQTLAAGGVWHGRTRNRRKDGRYYWEETTIAPLRLPDGRITHYIALKQDISDRHRAEQELRVALVRAEEASRAKSAFLATMSHELRTPLNAIIGFSDLIRQKMFGDAVDAYVQYAEDIHESGQRLRTVIGDVLEMAKLEAGRYELQEELVHLHEALAWVLPLLDGMANDGKVALHVDVPSALPPMWADPLAVRQVLLNLIGNAIKFTDPGGTVWVTGALDDHGHAAITIRDTGIGIPEDERERIFEPFRQADMRLARTYEGAGLGLTISRSFMELHGGSLSLDSRVGSGTTVTLRFPRERVGHKMSA